MSRSLIKREVSVSWLASFYIKKQNKKTNKIPQSSHVQNTRLSPGDTLLNVVENLLHLKLVSYLLYRRATLAGSHSFCRTLSTV